MLAHTLKSVVKQLKNFAGDKTIFLNTFDKKSERGYNFEITSSEIWMEVQIGNSAGRSKVDDIEMIELPKFLKILSLKEESYFTYGGIFEEQKTNVAFEAQLFVKVFRIMKERAFFTVTQNSNYLDCYYVDGKVFYIEETDDEYKVMGTDLFKLHNSHNNYRIFTVDTLPQNMDYSTFLDEQERIAKTLNKKFVKYRFGQPV